MRQKLLDWIPYDYCLYIDCIQLCSAPPNPHPSSGFVSIKKRKYNEALRGNTVHRDTYWWRKSSLLGDDDTVNPKNRDRSAGTIGREIESQGHTLQYDGDTYANFNAQSLAAHESSIEALVVAITPLFSPCIFV